MAEEDRCPDCGQLRLAQERLLQQLEKEYKMRSRLTDEIAKLRLRVHELEVAQELTRSWNARKVQRQGKAIRQLEAKLRGNPATDEAHDG